MTDAPRGADQPADQPAAGGPAGPSEPAGPTVPEVPSASGDAAVSAAAARAQFTRAVNLSDLPPLPVPEDTANVRQGPELHPDCLSMLPLVGVWRGTGQYGNTPRDEGPHFGQQITVAHDGRPFLRFESVTWRIASGADDLPTPGEREVGFLRPQPDGSLELLLTHAEGRIEVFYGQARSVASWAMSTDSVWRTPTGSPVVGATRLYGITPDGRLAYVEERAHTDEPLAPHASAALERIAG